MNSEVIEYSDPRVLTMFGAIIVVFVSAKLMPEAVNGNPRHALRQIIGHAFLTAAILVLGVTAGLMLAQDGSIEAMMFVPIAALCILLFAGAFIFKPLKDTVEAFKTLRAVRSTQ